MERKARLLDVLDSARNYARQHSTETDTYTQAQWMACLQRAWRRLWGRWPEAFHIGMDRVGELPECVVDDEGRLPVAVEYTDVLAAAVASDAVWAIVGNTPEQVSMLAAAAARLDGLFERGV